MISAVIEHMQKYIYHSALFMFMKAPNKQRGPNRPLRIRRCLYMGSCIGEVGVLEANHFKKTKPQHMLRPLCI